MSTGPTPTVIPPPTSKSYIEPWPIWEASSMYENLTGTQDFLLTCVYCMSQKLLQKTWIKRSLLTGLSKVMNHAVTGIVLQHSPITVHKLIWILSIVISQQASCPPSKWLWQGEDKIWDLCSHLNCYAGIIGEGWGNGVIASSRDLDSLVRVSIVHICEVIGDVIAIGQHNKATILIPYLK